jgi:transcriptional regulator with XRE-family HTH domain
MADAPGGRPLTERHRAFGPRLRAARERAGIRLESVAGATKIKYALLAGLERDDLSQWPKGIFRRAFVREYARALGLPVEETLAEFLRVFPEDPPQGDGSPAPPPTELRLTLAVEPERRLAKAFRRALTASLDLGLVVLAGGITFGLGAGTFWAATALAALVYYPLTQVCLGRTLFDHWLSADLRGRRTPRRSLGLNMRVTNRRPDLSFPISAQGEAGADVGSEHRRTA